jgi:hypothetical protein
VAEGAELAELATLATFHWPPRAELGSSMSSFMYDCVVTVVCTAALWKIMMLFQPFGSRTGLYSYYLSPPPPRSNFDCNLVLGRKLIIGTPPALCKNHLYTLAKFSGRALFCGVSDQLEPKFVYRNFLGTFRQTIVRL